MKQVIVSRSDKATGMALLRKSITMRFLNEKNAEFAQMRKQRLAVFAHDWIGACIYLDGCYERESIDDIFQLFQAFGIETAKSSAIDVGANIGNHTIAFASQFRSVAAFEPNKTTYDILSFNTSQISNVSVFNMGCSDKEGDIELSEDKTNSGGASAIHFRGSTGKSAVRVGRLDDIASHMTNVKLIKIDVEGMEYQVLQGALKLLAQHQPIVAFEQHESEFKSHEEETDSIRLLRTFGYEMFWSETLRRWPSVLPRKVRNLLDVLFGRTAVRSVVTDARVPRRTHSLIIAVPKIHSKMNA